MAITSVYSGTVSIAPAPAPAETRRQARRERDVEFAARVAAKRELQRHDAGQQIKAALAALGPISAMSRKEFAAARAKSLALLRRAGR